MTQQSPAAPPAAGSSADHPDLTVPLVADGATVARWRDADEHGSADAAYAIGLLAAQGGHRGEALDAWRRADTRGSAEASYALGITFWQGGQAEEAEEAWRRSADRGSASATCTLAALSQSRGDDVEATQLADRALELAQTADEQGSADGSCLVAQLLAWKQQPDAAEAAWRRADERGAPVAAYAVAYLDYQRGELASAEAAAARADDGGLAVGALVHGNFLDASDHHREAVAAWRRARRLAKRQGDAVTAVAAQRALHPSGRSWLRAHRARTLLIAAALLATGVFVSVAAALAVLLALAAVYAWNRPLRPGSPIDATPITSGSGIAVGGLSVSADVGAALDPRFQTSSWRPAALRDTAYFTIWPLLLGAGALVFAAWASGLIDGDAVLRAGFLAYALVIVWKLAWAGPSALRGEDPGGTSDGTAASAESWQDSVGLSITVPGPVPFTSWTFHGAIEDPRLMPLVEWVRARRQANAMQDSWAGAVRGVLTLTGWALWALFFAAMAIAPDRGAVTSVARDTVSVLIGMSVFAVGISLCLVKSARALRERDARALAASLGYLLATGAVLAVASWVGLLDAWLGLLQSIT